MQGPWGERDCPLVLGAPPVHSMLLGYHVNKLATFNLYVASEQRWAAPLCGEAAWENLYEK